MKKLVGLMALAILGTAALVLVRPAVAEDKDEKAKTISEIMKAAHGGRENSLRAKVLAGKAGDDGAKKLLALYKDLPKNSPPKGDKKAWAERTGAIVKAAEALAKEDNARGRRALGRATACMSCHDTFRAE